MSSGKKIAIGFIIFFGIIILLGGLVSVFLTSPYNDSVYVSTSQKTESDENSEPYQPSEKNIPVDGIGSDTFSIGESVTIGNFVYKVESVFTTPLINTYVSEADGVFLVIEISIENEDNEEIYISSTDFKIRDSNDRIYNVDSESVFLGTFGLDPLTFDTLGAGLETTRGIVFDVPEDDTGLVLEINSGFLSEKKLIYLGNVEDL